MKFPDALETSRLRLRRLQASDADAVFAYASDPEVTRYMTFPLHSTVDQSVGFLGAIQQRMDQDVEFHWGLVPLDSSEIIGVVSMTRTHGLELGYVLNRAQWGHGYMPEAIRRLIQWGFGEERTSRIWATCNVENTKSAAVLQKVGMTEEGILRRWAFHPNVSDVPSDARVFSITR